MIMERQKTWSRRQRRNRGGYNQQHKRQYSRRIEPSEQSEHGYPRSYGTRFLRQEPSTEYPETFHPQHSRTWVRSDNARQNDSSAGLENYTDSDVILDRTHHSSRFSQRRRYSDSSSYIHYNLVEDVAPDLPYSEPNFTRNRYYDHAAEDVVSDQPFLRLNFTPKRRRADSPSRTSYRVSEEVVRDQSFRRPFSPRRKRKSDQNPSYTNFRPDSRRPDSYYNGDKRPGNFKRKQQYYERHREDRYEHDSRGSKSLLNKQSGFVSKRVFKKPKPRRVKLGNRHKMQVNKSINNELENPSYDPKDPPVSETVASAKSLAEDKAEAKVTKKCGKKSSEDDAEAILAKNLAASFSEDNAEAKKAPFSEDKVESEKHNDAILHGSLPDKGANFTKKLGTKFSEDDAEANPSKKLAKKSSKDDAGANFTKKLDNAEANPVKETAAQLAKDNAEANTVKEPAAQIAEGNAEANNVTQKPAEVKSSNSDHTEVERDKKNEAIAHGSSSGHNG